MLPLGAAIQWDKDSVDQKIELVSTGQTHFLAGHREAFLDQERANDFKKGTSGVGAPGGTIRR